MLKIKGLREDRDPNGCWAGLKKIFFQKLWKKGNGGRRKNVSPCSKFSTFNSSAKFQIETLCFASLGKWPKHVHVSIFKPSLHTLSKEKKESFKNIKVKFSFWKIKYLALSLYSKILNFNQMKTMFGFKKLVIKNSFDGFLTICAVQL